MTGPATAADGDVHVVTGTVRALWTDARFGDPRAPSAGEDPVDPSAGADRPFRVPAVLAGTAVRWLHQVHGATVRRVGPDGGRPGPDGTWGDGDALVARGPGVALAVLTADCAPVALGSDEGVFAAVHAGWRGLVAGVVAEAASAMRAMGATAITGALGPCIHVGCYEFGEPELDSVAARFGDGVRGATPAGRPALDLPAAVGAALADAGVRQVAGHDACTACDPGYLSHRARGDRRRQALFVWSATGPEPR